jgi:hypothetical protein
MRKALGVLLVVAALAGMSVASADTVALTRNESGFPNNFNTGVQAPGLNWGLLVANTTVASGSSFAELGETVNFSTGSGFTYVQCPTSKCTWNGDFTPGQILLGSSGGSTTLNFSENVSGVGFQAMPGFVSPVPNDEYIEIGVYDGATLSASFFSGLFGGPVGGDTNTAGFYGITNLTGANITSIRLLGFMCTGVADCSSDGVTINHTLLNIPSDAAAVRLPQPASTPEPAGLALVGSGLGILGFLRRKLAARK